MRNGTKFAALAILAASFFPLAGLSEEVEKCSCTNGPLSGKELVRLKTELGESRRLNELDVYPTGKTGDVSIRFEFDCSLALEGSPVDGFVEDRGTPLSSVYTGAIKLIPKACLTDSDDPRAYGSRIFHQLIHVQQSYELWKYWYRENSLPEWRVKMHYAVLPDLKEPVFHIGTEFDAFYRELLFENDQKRILPGTLAGFFHSYFNILRSPVYGDFEEVKKYVDGAYDEVVQMTRQTLSSFLEKMKRAE